MKKISLYIIFRQILILILIPVNVNATNCINIAGIITCGSGYGSGYGSISYEQLSSPRWNQALDYNLNYAMSSIRSDQVMASRMYSPGARQAASLLYRQLNPPMKLLPPSYFQVNYSQSLACKYLGQCY